MLEDHSVCKHLIYKTQAAQAYSPKKRSIGEDQDKKGKIGEESNSKRGDGNG